MLLFPQEKRKEIELHSLNTNNVKAHGIYTNCTGHPYLGSHVLRLLPLFLARFPPPTPENLFIKLTEVLWLPHLSALSYSVY